MSRTPLRGMLALLWAVTLHSTSAFGLELALDTTRSEPNARYFTVMPQYDLAADLRHQRTSKELEQDCETIESLATDDTVGDEVLVGLYDDSPAVVRIHLPEFAQNRGKAWRDAFEAVGADDLALIVIFERGFVPQPISMSIEVAGELPADRRASVIDTFRSSVAHVPPADLDTIGSYGYLDIEVPSPIVSCWLSKGDVTFNARLAARALRRVELEWIVDDKIVLRALNFTNAEFPRHVAASRGRATIDRIAAVLFSSVLTKYTDGILSAEINHRVNEVVTQWLRISEARLNYVLSPGEQQALIAVFRDEKDVAAIVTYANAGGLQEIR